MSNHTNMETGAEPDSQSPVLWERCSAGEIDGMVRRIKGRRRKAFTAQLAGGAAFGILLGFLFVGLAGPREHDFGGITCTEVRAASRAYMAGILDADVSARIKIHLAECPTCRPMFRKIMKDQARGFALMSRAVAQADGGGHFESVCPPCGHHHSQHGHLAAARVNFLQPVFASTR